MAFPVESRHIDAAEQELGRKLPEALRARLLRNNGGELEGEDEDWQLHPVWDPSDRKRMARTANHVVRETKYARQEASGFPPDAIAIAENGCGDLLVLRPGRDELERWDHETRTCGPADVALD